jgi:hypothetical protein
LLVLPFESGHRDSDERVARSNVDRIGDGWPLDVVER